MDANQIDALRKLNEALQHATDTGALDELQPHCDSPDSINDVCDAIDFALVAARKEGR